MITSSEIYDAIINKCSRTFKGRFLLDGEPLSCEIKKIKITKGACGSDYLPGAVFIPYVEAEIADCDEPLEGNELEVQIGLLIGYGEDGAEESEFITVGSFTVDDCKRTTSGITVSAVGRLAVKCSGLYESTLAFPALISSVINEIENQAGVSIIFHGADVAGLSLEKKPQGLLYKDMLGYIAGVLGGYVTEDSLGNIVIATFSKQNPVHVNGDRSLSLPEFAESDFKISGVKVIATEAVKNEEGNNITGESFSYGDEALVLNNPFMTAELFEVMKENLRNVVYRPGKLPLSLGDPRLEPWDCLQVENLNGIKYIMPCLNITHTFDGGLSSEIEAPGKTAAVGRSTPKGPITQQLERMHSLLLTANDAILKRLKADDAEIIYAKISELKVIKEAVDTLIANEITASYLEANFAKADSLEAIKARIDTLVTNVLTVEKADVKYAAIGELTALKTVVEDLEAEIVTVEYLEANYSKTETLDAEYAKIEELNSAKGEIYDLQAENVSVKERLTAAEANVGNLSTDVADINTLMFGSASGDVLQAEFADAVVALISDATIDNAKIVSVIADKITSGQLNTNKVNIQSDSGRLQITGDAIIVKDASRTRVQIGKDANDDYNIYVLDDSGNIMFDATGVHADAIKSPIIVNDMVSDNASISAGKLDIDSLFTEINGSDKTINAAKILIDTKGQTLDMAFSTVTESIGDIETSLTSQGTELVAIQGKIEAKIWQEDITTATSEMVTRTDITNMSTQIKAKIDGLQVSVEETYTTKSESANQKEDLLKAVKNEIDISSDGILLNLENVEKQVSDVGGELKEYVDYTSGFIKAGVLFFESADVNGTQVPMKKIGVAIGQNLGKTTIVDPDTGEEIEGIAQQGLYSVFTADRLSFYQNTAEVAYISNEKLYIKKAEIFEGYLKIGKWLVNTDNDFWNLEWEG